jgi:hypothetical protein
VTEGTVEPTGRGTSADDVTSRSGTALHPYRAALRELEISLVPSSPTAPAGQTIPIDGDSKAAQ